MARTLEARMTLAEFLASPMAEETPSWEYLPGGRLVRKVSPSLAHGVVQMYLGHLLLSYVLQHGVEAEVVSETRAAFEQWSPVPDITVYGGRVPRDEQGELPKYPAQQPVLTVEIRSPGQGRESQLARCEDMVRQGTPLSLMVDPSRLDVTAVTDSGRTRLSGKDRLPLELVPPLSGLELTVEDVFARFR